MTAIQSIKKALEIWKHLRDNPNISSKLTVYDEKQLKEDKNRCPLCEYAYRKKKELDGYTLSFCNFCPALEEWQEFYSDDRDSFFCETFEEFPKTPWDIWRVNDLGSPSNDHKKHHRLGAHKMVGLLRKAFYRNKRKKTHINSKF